MNNATNALNINVYLCDPYLYSPRKKKAKKTSLSKQIILFIVVPKLSKPRKRVIWVIPDLFITVASVYYSSSDEAPPSNDIKLSHKTNNGELKRSSINQSRGKTKAKGHYNANLASHTTRNAARLGAKNDADKHDRGPGSPSWSRGTARCVSRATIINDVNGS